MKKYEVFYSRYDIIARVREIECEKETDKCIWINGRRRAKFSEYENYFDTWHDAHNKLLTWQQNIVASLRLRLDTAKDRLGNIKGMKP